MEASTQNSTNPTLRHLNAQVPEQAQPPLIAPARSSQSEPLPSLNQAGSLAGPSAPASIGLRSRQVQEGSAGAKSIRQCMYEASQLLKQGQAEEAGAMYISLLSNTEVYIRDRLNCAKKLLNISPISTQAPKAAHLLVEIAQDANIEWADRLKAIKILVKHPMFQDQAGNTLVGMVKDAKLADTDRLKAIKILAKWPRFQDKAVAAFKAFAAVFESEAIEPGVQKAARDRIVPLLFSRVKDLTLFPTDRIDAAEELSKLVGEDQQGEVWSALIHERLTYIHPAYGMKVAEKLGQIPAYRACAAGYLLYLGRYKNHYIPWNIQAFEKLSKIPGYEATAAQCLLSLSQNFKDNNNSHDNVIYFNQWEVAEALSKIPGQEENAATVLVNITKGPLSMILCFHHTAERLSKIPGQEAKSKEAWDYIASYNHSHPSMVSSRILGMRALLDLFGEKDKAAELLTKIANDKEEPIEHRILAVDNLARIPEKEAEAAQMKSTLEAILQDTKRKIESAKNNLQIPDKKEEAANELLQIAKNPALAFSDRMLAGDTLSAVPEQEPKAIEAWLAMYACPKFLAYKKILAAGKLSRLTGQADRARKLVDKYMISINDTDKYFLV